MMIDLCQITKINNCVKSKLEQLNWQPYRLGTWEFQGSNPGKGDNFSLKIGKYCHITDKTQKTLIYSTQLFLNQEFPGF